MITSIELNNFKCFRTTSVTLSPLTILAGANGAGKSTVVQALLVIRQAIEKIRHLESGGDVCDVSVSLNGPYGLALGNTQAVISANTDAEEFMFVLGDGTDSYMFAFNSPVTRPERSVTLLSSSEIQKIDSGDTSCSIFDDEFVYLAAERLGPRVVQDIPDADVVSPGVHGEHVGYSIHRANDSLVDEQRCLQTQTLKLFHVQLEAWLDKIMPGVQVRSKIYEEIGKVNVGIKKRVSETDYLIPSNIGFGISYVLPIIVAGLTVPKGSVLIIENPEAHLHPAGQTAIGKFLSIVAGSGVQVILETHSEHIVNGARIAVLEEMIDAEKVLINYFDTGTAEPEISALRIDTKGELSSWPSGFFDQQEKDLSSIFRLRQNARV